MNRHRMDPISLVASLFFVVIAIRSMTGGADLDALSRLGWLVPAAVITVGVMILSSALRGRRTDEDR